jgi:penicillin-insensitive murein endopeptidase
MGRGAARGRGGTVALGVALAVLALGGCASRQVLGGDGSVSFGPSNAGALLEAARLPATGAGFRVPTIWRARGLGFGTEELIGLIVGVGAELERTQPGRALAVADLSLRRGGPSAWHRSHQTGRDVDLIYFARDAAGRPVDPEAMRRFDAAGRTTDDAATGGAPLVFDDAANWAMVRALVTSTTAEVQYAFISDDLKQRLLDHAEATGEDPAVVAAAAVILRQPGDSLPHDDHVHVRIFCSPTDRELGCEDAGAREWRKKDEKYRGRAPTGPAVASAR